MSRYTASSCIGIGLAQTHDALQRGSSGLTHCEFDTVDLDTYIGEVAGVDEVQLPPALADYDCRNNRLALLGLRQDGFEEAVTAAANRYGRSRIGVFLGTSTSGILQAELAYRHRDPANGALPPDFKYAATQNTYSVAAFVRRYFELSGPAMTVSTACSSSAKAFASAWRMIETGVIDAAIVGGVDSLCLTTLYGFNSLELTSPQPCRPFDVERNGISIGEAAAFILLEKAPAATTGNEVMLIGVGESSDAYHMSSPHPQGRGAQQAMAQALQVAGLAAEEIDYINLHGTATPSNDTAEGTAVMTLFGNTVPCSSTKGATGHTLGAAGGLEAVICALALQHGFVPGSPQTATPDPALPLDYAMTLRNKPLTRVLSNSFGFGGTNCSLIFQRAN